MGAVIFDRVYASSAIYDWYKTVRGKGMNNYGRVLRSATLWLIFPQNTNSKDEKANFKAEISKIKVEKVRL